MTAFALDIVIIVTIIPCAIKRDGYSERGIPTHFAWGYCHNFPCNRNQIKPFQGGGRKKLDKPSEKDTGEFSLV